MSTVIRHVPSQPERSAETAFRLKSHRVRHGQAIWLQNASVHNVAHNQHCIRVLKQGMPTRRRFVNGLAVELGHGVRVWMPPKQLSK